MKLGYCDWLLCGIRGPEKIRFLAEEGFKSISFLQCVMDMDPVEAGETAAAIKEHHFNVCYHGNVPVAADGPDLAATEKMFANVMWWHEHTDGVRSCCSDRLPTLEATRKLLQLEHDFFEDKKIGYGIENCFPKDNKYSNSRLEHFQAFAAMYPEARYQGMIFDAGHANIALNLDYHNQLGMYDYVTRIPYNIYELHLTDNHGENDEHFIPGAGTVDFHALKTALDARNFDGALTFEVCVDIQHGKYGFDLSKEENRDYIRRIRDEFLARFK